MARAARWADGVDGAWTLDGDEATVRAAFDTIDARRGRRPAATIARTCRRASGTRSATTPRTGSAHYAYDYLKIFGEAAGQFGAPTPSRASRPTRCDERSTSSEAAGADEVFLVPTTADPAELDRAVAALG